ncbi:MAG: hypothetical protein IPH08_13845 [Rhodocyclaceae bacterium]|nr:hypothetical protein [Rhodocyclaceae bacterium]
MLKKLLGRLRNDTSTNLFGSSERLAELIDALPIEPEHRLIEAGEFLAQLPAQVATLGLFPTLRALAKLDAATREARQALLESYFDSGMRDHVANTLLDNLGNHLELLLAAYALLLGFKPPKPEEFLDKDRAYLARTGARALRIWTLQLRVAHFRYRGVSERAWRQAHELLATLGTCGVLQSPVLAYPGDEKTTPFREYLVAAYLHLAPMGNLDPLQQELLARLLAEQPAFDCLAQPGGLSTHRINLMGAGGPERYQAGELSASGVQAPAGAVWRYLSTARLRSALLKLEAAVRQTQNVPPWLVALPLSREQTQGALAALLAHWGATPPQRRNDRSDQNQQLRAAFGFSMARRFVAASQFARSGRSLRYDIIDPDEMYKAHHLVSVGKDAAPAPVVPEAAPNPMDTLNKLESAGDRSMTENWLQVDVSASGMGVAAPALLPRHAIGALVAIRFVDGLEWRMGLIRRIGRDAQGRPNLGLQTLPWPSFSARLRIAPGEHSQWAAALDDEAGWIDAILISEESGELMLPLGAYHEKMEIDLRSELGLQRICLSRLIERGSDFEWVSFESV